MINKAQNASAAGAANTATSALRLVYTFTQRQIDGGAVLVAACVANLGEASASAIDVTFALLKPLGPASEEKISSLRAPSEPGEVNGVQASAVIGQLQPRQQKQFEILVRAGQLLKPDELSIVVPKAYRLSPKDPALTCAPQGINSKLPKVTTVQFTIGGDAVSVERAIEVLEASGAISRRPSPNPNFPSASEGPVLSTRSLTIAFGILLVCIVAALFVLAAIGWRERYTRS